MTIKDIVEIEAKGTSVPVAPAPKPTSQESSRSRGNFVPGRSVPSKRIRVMHRCSRSAQPLKQWVVSLKGEDYNTGQEWFRNKAATG